MIPQRIKDDVYFCERVPLRAEVEKDKGNFYYSTKFHGSKYKKLMTRDCVFHILNPK